MEPVTGVGSELVALPDKEVSASDILREVADDWKDLTMLSAIAFQVAQMTTKIFQTFLTQLFTLGSLVMGAYYVNACKYMQTFKESAQKLEATNAALNEKVARLETAAGTLVTTIAQFDTETAEYFASLAEHDSGLQNSVERINHAADAFSRVLQDGNLSFLWRETLEAVKEFQQAKAEYDQIHAAIQAERETLAQLHVALSQDESNLADLYRAYSDTLREILSRSSQPPQGQ